MSRRLLAVLAVVLATAVYLLVREPTEQGSRTASVRAAQAATPAPGGDARDVEVERIQTHLAGVEADLRARDVSHLTAEQRAARARHLDVLQEYWQAGLFPHNHDFAGARLPIFVDEHGTLCAMAYLIARSGGTALVKRVATARNYAYIHELADDGELIAWLDQAGLTVEEAGRIQPEYDYFQPGAMEDIDRAYAALSVLSLGLTSLSSIYNVANLRRPDGPPAWSGVVGLAAGATAFGLGLARIDRDGATGKLGAVNAGVGALGATIGGITLLRRPEHRPATARAAAETGVPAPAPGWALELRPAVSPSGANGLELRLHF